jgi:hypothetical protein
MPFKTMKGVLKGCCILLPINEYKKMKSIITTILLSIVTRYSAQIYYHDIVPDSTINTWNTYLVQPSSSAQLYVWWHPGDVSVDCYGMEVRFDSNNNLPDKLGSGNNISAAGTWSVANYDLLSDGASGNWLTNATDKYLAFRFNSNGGWHYGWLKVTVGASVSFFTVKEWAYNQTADAPIDAGQTTVGSAPAITSLSGSATLCVGAKASLSVQASGTGLSYQWRKGTTALADGGNISGATTASLVIQQVAAADSSSFYNVVVSNSFTQSTSANTKLAVKTCATAGIKENMLEPFTAYPNPFSEQVTLELPRAEGNLEVRVFNVLGAEVLRGEGNGKILNIDTSRLPAAYYQVSVWDEGTPVGIVRMIKY